MTYYTPRPIRTARYYPTSQRLTYYIADRIQVTRTGLNAIQARDLIQAVADGPNELVQRLEIVPIDKL